MFTRTRAVTAGLAAALALSACSGSEESAPEPTPQPTQQPTAESTAPAEPDTVTSTDGEVCVVDAATDEPRVCYRLASSDEGREQVHEEVVRTQAATTITVSAAEVERGVEWGADVEPAARPALFAMLKRAIDEPFFRTVVSSDATSATLDLKAGESARVQTVLFFVEADLDVISEDGPATATTVRLPSSIGLVVGDAKSS